jgi:hypothetical protein
MQRIQELDESGFLTAQQITEELESGYQRRDARVRQKPEELFICSRVFFNKLIEDWVKDRKGSGVQDGRTVPRDHKIAGFMDYHNLTDEWWKCFLTNPFETSPLYAPPRTGHTSPFIFSNNGTDQSTAKAYMIGISGFRFPDVRKIVVTERVPILIPVYVTSAAAEEQLWDPDRQSVSVGQNDLSRTLTDIIVDDLCGLYDIYAELDKKPINGCTVLRNRAYQVPNIPSDNVRGVPSDRLGINNSMNVCHGGFYIVLNPDSEVLNRGEHLLHLKAHSVNYEVEAKIHIGIIAT